MVLTVNSERQPGTAETRYIVHILALMRYFVKVNFKVCTNRQVPTASRTCYNKQLLKMELVSGNQKIIVINVNYLPQVQML